MNAIWTIAGKEFKDALRNRWILAATALLALLALSLAFVGTAPVGSVRASMMQVTVISLASLSVFLVPLIALMLSYDTIVGDIERGSMLLLMTYPVSRWQLIFGKFLGHSFILSLATTVGYGSAGILIAANAESTSAQDWGAFAGLIGSTILLGSAFISLGYLLSVMVKERATAIGLAVAVWLFFVLLYDMAVLGILVVDQGETLKADLVNLLLLFNPADSFRLLNLTGFDGTAALSGMSSIAGRAILPPWFALGALGAWIMIPFTISGFLFSRREL
ncbi:ABC transporter permease [Kiloniella laminariae]|uniref:ABC transporter permease n=1 Tax=Kiloniella laminariae TaxID=454162 RepID=A0ABT4LK00_9PROT|nr:ABC transporter permease [Kiloniella laminariae]MCZ4281402.1 ABC transporter permease [Kiloniella laminariae]